MKAFQGKYWPPVAGRVDQRACRTLKRLAEPVEALPRRCAEVAKATWLFDQVPVGTRVHVYWS